jgi:hypothetical protein
MNPRILFAQAHLTYLAGGNGWRQLGRDGRAQRQEPLHTVVEAVVYTQSQLVIKTTVPLKEPSPVEGEG